MVPYFRGKKYVIFQGILRVLQAVAVLKRELQTQLWLLQGLGALAYSLSWPSADISIALTRGTKYPHDPGWRSLTQWSKCDGSPNTADRYQNMEENQRGIALMMQAFTALAL